MFKSKAQQAYLEIHEPEVAKEFADKTSKEQYKNMPKYVSKDKNGLKEYTKKYRRKKHE